MPLTTYTPGEVLTAASLNANFSFAASTGILQVVSAIKTDTFSTTSTTFVDVTDVTVSITPATATNKVLVFVSGVVGSNATNNFTPINLVRDSTTLHNQQGQQTLTKRLRRTLRQLN